MFLAEFKLIDIVVLLDSKEQPWFKWIRVEKCVAIAWMVTLTTKLAEEDMKSWVLLQAEGLIRTTNPINEAFKIKISSHLSATSV